MRLMGIRIYVIALAYRINLLYFQVIRTRHVQDRNETSERKCRKKVFWSLFFFFFIQLKQNAHSEKERTKYFQIDF